MSLKPLPPLQFPLAGGAPPEQAWAEYFDALDQLVRSGPGFSIAGLAAADASGVGHTLTAANFFAGVLLRSGPAGAFADTTPTAAELVAQIARVQGNLSRLILIANAGGGLMTLTVGVGVTLVGNTTIAAGSGRFYLVTVTGATRGAEAVTVRGLMTGTM